MTRAEDQPSEANWESVYCSQLDALGEPSAAKRLYGDTVTSAGFSLHVWLAAVRASPDDPHALEMLAEWSLGIDPGSPVLPRYGTSWPWLAIDPFLAGDLLQPLDIFAAAATGGRDRARWTRVCTSLALSLRQYGVAHDCIDEALARGEDSTWNLLRLSWLAFHRGDTLIGSTFFRRAVAAANTRDARIDLGWHFKSHAADVWGAMGWLPASPPDSVAVRERERWLALPTSQLVSWIRKRARSSDGARLWNPLATDSVLASHFGAVTFMMERFRDCVDHELTSPCVRGGSQELSAKRLRFWAPDGSDLSIVPFRFVGPVAEAGQPLAVTLRLKQWDDPQRLHRDSTRRLLLPRADSSGKRDGVVGISGDDSLSSWDLSLAYAPDAVARDFEDGLPWTACASTCISDLAIGVVGQDPVIALGSASVPVSPADSFAARRPVTVSYQTRCIARCTTARTTIAVNRVDGKEHGASIRLATTAPMRSGLTLAQRTLDLSRIKPGEYRIEVEIADEHGVQLVSRHRDVVVW
ncbi:MAG TPA: hypothetical protein VHW65_07955 [Gemmatimonadales bacterium]|nr:hypothetical protein [Gemmatimonadales bacterium]